MKQTLLKLEPFEKDGQEVLDAKFLAKIMGGGDHHQANPSYQCNNPKYTFSAQMNADVETAKER